MRKYNSVLSITLSFIMILISFSTVNAKNTSIVEKERVYLENGIDPESVIEHHSGSEVRNSKDLKSAPHFESYSGLQDSLTQSLNERGLVSTIVGGKAYQGEAIVRGLPDELSFYIVSTPTEFKKGNRNGPSDPASTYELLPYSENSQDGFTNAIESNDGRFYLYRIRSSRMVKHAAGPLVNHKKLISIPKGLILKLTEEFINKTYSSITFKTSQSANTSINFGVKDVIGIKVNAGISWETEQTESTEVTHKYSKEQTFSYPKGSQYENDDIAVYYTAFNHDTYEVIVDIVPCSLSEKQLTVFYKAGIITPDFSAKKTIVLKRQKPFGITYFKTYKNPDLPR
ncbi:hypothetical protein [Wukongibacter sp. M2B1]|uniref:hypothetical protein n=1 Tax=Wukongibacter sp. M2B1 TaxID=3088895 RepID=UPI003D796C3D